MVEERQQEFRQHALYAKLKEFSDEKKLEDKEK